MRIDLTDVRRKTLFVAFVLFVLGILTFLSGKAFLAAHWNASENPELWLKAARLEPGNSEYWGHVGVSQQWELEPGRIQAAIRYLQKATEINPRSADLWMELADAYVSSGDPAHALEAFEKAQASYPMSAEVAWRYGSFLLYQGKPADGNAEIHRAIAIDPSLTRSALAECWRSDPNISSILDMVLPSKPEYYESAIDFFLSQRLPDPALAVWNRQRELRLPLELSEAIPLVDVLIELDRVEEAQQIWRDAVQIASRTGDSVNTASLIFNGWFEHEVMNGGFDWREAPSGGAHIALDERVVHAGSRSLRIQFDGTENIDFQHLFQYVPVVPGARYHFSAFLRTEGISTDRGVCFEILDPRHPSQVQVRTPEVRGTNSWTQVQTDLVAGSETHLLKIILRRLPSWKFDSKIIGTTWVGDVVLTPSYLPSGDSAG